MVNDPVAVLTRAMQSLPDAALRRIAASPTPTAAAVARALLEIRAKKPADISIFSS